MNSTYSYDVAGRLSSVVHAGTGGTLQSFTYTLDAVGNRKSVISLAGTENYTLDNLNRLMNVANPNGDAIAYSYDDLPPENCTTVNCSPPPGRATVWVAF